MNIYTDSSSDLAKEFFSENSVTLFPLAVELNGQFYEDIVGISSLEIYDAIQKGAQPKTSQVSPEQFLTAFEQLAERDEEGIYMALSSELSGTYNTAVMIKNQLMERYPNLKLTIIDTKCVSVGLGFLVKEAVRLRDEGKTLEEIETIIVKKALHREHIFTVGDLDFLAKGGRVSKTSAFVGGLLNIKPILTVKEGRLLPIDKVRGHKKSIARMIDLMEECGEDFSNQVIGLCHSNDPAFLQDVQTAVEARLSPKGFDISLIGSVVGSHVGLGTVGIFFDRKE